MARQKGSTVVPPIIYRTIGRSACTWPNSRETIKYRRLPVLPPFHQLRTLVVWVDNPVEARANLAAERLADIHELLRNRMRYVQAKYIDADAHRLASASFEPGDMVFLDTRNTRAIRPSWKLGDKNASLFVIVRPINPRAHKFDLPGDIELRARVFHSSPLELARRYPLAGQVNPLSPPVIVREWLVEDILDSR